MSARLATVVLVVALGACSKTGDALLVLNVRSAIGSRVVRTFKVTVSTVPEAGPPKTDELKYELPDAGTVVVFSTTPTVLGVLVSADLGAVTVKVHAFGVGSSTELASGSSSTVKLSRGAKITVEILLGQDASSDGGTGDGDASEASGAAGAAGEAGGAGAAGTTVVGERRWALWPMPNNVYEADAGAPNAAMFDNHGDGTVTDLVTGLTWQYAVPSAAMGLLTQTEGADYCQTLDLGTHRDWRLPSLIELASIVDDSQTNPTISHTGFAVTAADFPYWTSTPVADTSGTVWTVNFIDGSFAPSDPSALFHSRCVRSDRAGAGRDYTTSTGEVTDNHTKLTWRVDASTPMIWADGHPYCKNRGAGWRMPTKSELLTIVDYSRANPAVDSSIFAETLDTLFWSSTPKVVPVTSAWVVDFSLGTPEYRTVMNTIRVRCVRSTP